MINLDHLDFQQLDYDGLKTLVSWAQKEGWNPGPQDADVFWATDPNGFYGYVHRGELIAGGSIVAYDDVFGFMGFFIVKPEYRSLGIGKKLWYQRRDTLLKRLKKGAAIGMDGVVDMQPFYQKGGFDIAFRDVRYEKQGMPCLQDPQVSALTEEDVDSVLAYDLQCFGFSRPQFMKPWLKLPDSKSFKYVVEDELKGFVMARKAQNGYKVCPLFADDKQIADALYRACLHAVDGEQLYIDIPIINQGAVDLVESHNATYVFECARMYYGKPPQMSLDKVFGVTTFELG